MVCGCSSCSTCGCSPCSCGTSATRPAPAPYYNEAGSSQETHCQSVNLQFFATAIASANDFVMPACNNLAVITFPGVTQVQIGSYLWSSIVGYLKVESFDYRVHEVTVLNECLLGNVVAGTIIPRCTLFNITDSPYGIASSSSTITATGNQLINASPISTRITFVIGADGTKGVRLPAFPQPGREHFIYNEYFLDLNLYPGTVGDKLNGIAGTPIVIPSHKGAVAHSKSIDQWWVGLLT